MLLSLCLAVFLQDSPPTDMGTTVVKARKVTEALEDVPLAVSVLGADDLVQSGMRSISDSVGTVPNVHFTEFSARRLSFPYVRGIGSGLGEPSVVTYMDGVPQMSVGSTNLPLIGLERIEFLRGPQGTLYGRNALGGIINMVGRQPGTEVVSESQFMLGNHGLQEYSYSYGGPIGDKMGFVTDGQVAQRDGYTRNAFTGNLVDGREAFTGRALLSYDLDDSSSIRVGLHGQQADDGGFGLGELNSLRSDPHRINQDFEGATSRDFMQPSVVYEWEEAGYAFTSISAYTTWDAEETSDFDFSQIDGVRRTTLEDQDVFYQELRLSSEDGIDTVAGEGSRWLIGVSGFVSDSSRSAANEFRPGMFPPAMQGTDTNTGEFSDTSVSMFGQASMSPAPGVELTGGLRVDRETKRLDHNHTYETAGFTVLDMDTGYNSAFSEVTPMASASMRLDQDTMVYGYAAKAFKAGGYNLTAPDGGQLFDPETSWTYEVGYKRTILEGSAELKLAAFHVDWKDMQLSLFDPVAGGYVENAGESTSDGVEVEFDADLGRGFGLSVALGISTTEFVEFTDAYGQDSAGNALANAPEQTFNFGVRYNRPSDGHGVMFGRINFVAVQDLFYDPSNIESESYELVNASLGYRSGDWSANLFVRNMFDEEYVPVAFQANPADPTYFIGENGAPRTLGLGIGFSF